MMGKWKSLSNGTQIIFDSKDGNLTIQSMHLEGHFIIPHDEIEEVIEWIKDIRANTNAYLIKCPCCGEDATAFRGKIPTSEEHAPNGVVTSCWRCAMNYNTDKECKGIVR